MANVRHWIVMLIVISSSAIYISRTDLNIAIIYITNVRSHHRHPENAMCPASNVSSHFHFHRTTNGIISNNSNNKSTIYPETEDSYYKKSVHYDWDDKTQGYVIGSMYWGIILFQIPSAMLSQSIGCRWIISVSLIGSAVCAILTPVMTDSSVLFTVLIRFFMGIFQSGMFAAAFSLICNWIPVKERSFAFCLLDAGTVVGSVITYYAAGWICVTIGWKYLLYSSGIICLACFVIFTMYTTNYPHDHSAISMAELMKIHSDTEPEMRDKMNHPETPPYLQMMTNVPMMSIAFFKFSQGFAFHLFYIEMPKYLNEVIHEDIIDNGILNAETQAMSLFSMITSAIVSERLIQNKILSRTACRKMFSVLSGFAVTVCIVFVSRTACDLDSLTIILFITSTFLGCYTASDGPIAAEISKNYTATVFAILNTIYLSSAFLVPQFVAFILTLVSSQSTAWLVIFYTTSALLFISNIVFLIFASAERQEFDMIDREGR